MGIKEILSYDYNYAAYIVTDGQYEVKCLCLSVPLNNAVIKAGMTIKTLEIFINDEFFLKVLNEKSNVQYSIKKVNNRFTYIIAGVIFDSKKAIVKVGELLISLAPYFEQGLNKDFENNQFVEFKVDRLDSYIY